MASHLFPMPHYVYLAECADQTFYTGTCVDLKAREAKHNDGTGARYTRGRRPVMFIYHEKFKALSDARKREAAIKKMGRGEKVALIECAAGRNARSLSK